MIVPYEIDIDIDRPVYFSLKLSNTFWHIFCSTFKKYNVTTSLSQNLFSD